MSEYLNNSEIWADKPLGYAVIEAWGVQGHRTRFGVKGAWQLLAMKSGRESWLKYCREHGGDFVGFLISVKKPEGWTVEVEWNE